ncbi:hypothetical protein AB0M95_26570 [Sphaerisporangium sp. NPDC051017]|uniref:hypothetical protein n=1 Tax=Sphaerisporangium sp. NPDC051017 TaxID=3154636 RepID=UPI0034494340
MRAGLALARELERHGLCSEIHQGYGLALVSVWVDLVVWTDATCYIWWTGQFRPNGRRQLAYCAGNDPASAAARVAARYVELRRNHPHAQIIADVLESAGLVVPPLHIGGAA